MKPLPRFKFTLSRRLSTIAAIAILFAGLVIGVSSEAVYQRHQLRELDIQAATLAQSVAAAVMFSDTVAAGENARALGANPAIIEVGIYSADGALLASYVRDKALNLPATAPSPAVASYRGGFQQATAEIRRDGQGYGLVLVRKDRDSILVQFGRYAPFALLMTMAALVLGAVTRANSELTEANRRLTAEMSQRKHAEEALLQSRKMEAIGQLTGGVAHDFNNLLMVVSGGLAMLERHTNPARRQKTLDAMEQAVERGAALTGQLLAFARRQPLQRKAIDLERQVNGLRELLERSLRPDIDLRIDLPASLPPVKTDPSQFDLAVLNLAVNARDAMPDGGVLSITARRAHDQDQVEVIMRDSGAGMAPDVLQRVFEPYFTTKPLGQGTGLGLSQVYGFAQQNGGALRIDSVLGQGTAVILALPISEEAAPGLDEGASGPRTEGSGTPMTILVVEDNDGVAAAVDAMLEDLGHAPIRVNSAAEALDILKGGHNFDLVFSDIVMPGEMSGVDLSNALETLAPGLPVLLTTGYFDKEMEVRRPLLRKPYNREELRQAISALTRLPTW